MGFYLNEANALQELDHERIDKRIAWIRDHRSVYSSRWMHLLGGHPDRPGKRSLPVISQDTIDHLHDICDTIRASSQEFKVVVGVSQVWVYTNDTELPEALDKKTFLQWKRFTKAVVDRQKNTILLRNSKYTHRTYLKAIKITEETKVRITKFLESQEDAENSSSLNKWLAGPYHRMQDYYYINHNGYSLLTMLNLIQPGLIRKTSEIVAR